MRYILKEEQTAALIECHTSGISEHPSSAMLELEIDLYPCVTKESRGPSIKQKIYIKSLQHSTFYSTDLTRWFPLSPLTYLPGQKRFLSLGNQHYQLFQGYLPTHSSDQQQGGLITKIPGKVVKLLVKAGQSVIAGQPLVVLEAMKMENELKASADGVVSTIHVQEGQTVEAKTLLISLT